MSVGSGVTVRMRSVEQDATCVWVGAVAMLVSGTGWAGRESGSPFRKIYICMQVCCQLLVDVVRMFFS